MFQRRAHKASLLNIQGVFRHVLTDLYGFIGTAVAGVIILATGWTRADAIASLVVVVLMLKAAAELLRASGRVLLEAAPENIDLDDVHAHLLATEHVRGLHDLHAWTVTSTLPALSAHIVIDDSCFTGGHAPGYWISCRPSSLGTGRRESPEVAGQVGPGSELLAGRPACGDGGQVAAEQVIDGAYPAVGEKVR